MSSTINLALIASYKEAYIEPQHVTVLFGETVLTGLTRHLEAKGRLTPKALQKDLFPTLPLQVCKNLLSILSANELAIEEDGIFNINSEIIGAETPTRKLPDQQMLKVKYLNFDGHILLTEANVEAYRGNVFDTRNFYPKTLTTNFEVRSKFRSGISFQFGVGARLLENSKNFGGAPILEISKTGAVLKLGDDTIQTFGSVATVEKLLDQKFSDIIKGHFVVEVDPSEYRDQHGQKKLTKINFEGKTYEVAKHPKWELIPNSQTNAAELCKSLTDAKRNETPTEKQLRDAWSKNAKNWPYEFEEIFPE